jgi:hypothetical protein
MATIDPILTNKDYVKKEVFMELGDFSEKPMIKTNRIFLRKTRFTENFILEWMTRCNSPLLLPDTNYSDFYTTHTCDQAIFNGLYYKYFDSPDIYLKDNTFTRSNMVFLNKEVKKKDTKPPVKPKRPQPSRMLVPNTAPSRQVMWMRPIGYE